MLVLNKGTDDHEEAWQPFEPRTVSWGSDAWHPDGCDVDVLVMDDVEEDDVRAVVERPAWKGLKGARIKAHGLSDDVMAALAARGAFRHLLHLDLGSCYAVGDRTMAALAREAPALESLRVDWTAVTDAGLGAILAEGGPPLRRVRGVHLKYVTEQGLLAAYAAPVPNQWLSAPAEPEPPPPSSVLRDRVTQARTSVESIDRLDDDSLSWGDFPPEQVFDNEDYDRGWPSGAAEIAALPNEFAVFRYQNQDPNESALRRLLGSPLMRAVRYLDLRRNHRMADADLAAALRASELGQVELLSLDACYDVGAQTIAAVVERLPNLRALDVGQSAVGDAELEKLAALPSLRRVQGMFMEPALTQAGVAAFRATRPDVDLRFTWSR